MVRLCLGASVLFLATAAAAQETPAPPPAKSPIIALMVCTSDIVGNLEAKLNLQKAGMGDNSARENYSAHVAKLFKCTDDRLPAAIEAAGNNSDLKTAIKDYYVKARSYIEVLGMNDRAAYQEQSQAVDRVTMEMKIAHLL